MELSTNRVGVVQIWFVRSTGLHLAFETDLHRTVPAVYAPILPPSWVPSHNCSWPLAAT